MAEAAPEALAWRERLLIGVASWLLQVLAWTLRVRWEGRERLDECVASGRGVILAGWHGRILYGFHAFRRYRPVIMISQSRDGERVARLVERLGWRPVRGSSSRGGARALASLLRELRSGSVIGHVVDGPRGPREQVKPGLIFLAQRSGAPVIPVFLGASWRWQAGSWDRMQVPLPFSRVWIRLGEPIAVAPELCAESAELLRQQLEKRFQSGYGSLDLELRG